MKRVACYVRVSSLEQKKHGISVDSQISALTQYCHDNGLKIVDFYNDAGRSAHISYKKRPDLLRLIEDCKNDKVDLILFTKLDRWFRSLEDYYAVQGQLKDCSVPWRAIWEDYETETSAGVFKVNIMLSIAEAEASRTGERISAVKEYQRQQGWFVGGKAPVGYKIQDKHFLVVDEEKRAGVNAFFDTFLGTFSTRQAVIAANEAGAPIKERNALRILHNPYYYGDANGYQCEPYVTKEQWDRIQEIISMRTHKKTKNNNIYYFSGLLRCCYCGNALAGHTVPSKSKNSIYYYRYYSCNNGDDIMHDCKGVKISQKKLETYLIECMDNIIDETIKSDHVKQKSDPIMIEHAKLTSKLKRLADLYELGDIEKEEYITKRNKIKEELQKLEVPQTTSPDPLPQNWIGIYQSLDDPHKQSFWKKTFNHIVISSKESQILPKIIW